MKIRSFASVGFSCLAVGCFVIAAGTNSIVRAQAPAAATGSASLIAVLDLPKVFDSHPTFRSELEAIQSQLKQVDKQFEARQKELSERSHEVSNLSPTSPDYMKMESEFARQAADLQVQARQAKKDYLQREALQYYKVYNEIIAAVHHVAQRHHIGLVLRFDSREIDANSPQAIAQGLGRSVIVQRNLDITQHVVNELQLAVATVPHGSPRR